MRYLGVVLDLGLVVLVASATTCGGSADSEQADGGSDGCAGSGGGCGPEADAGPSVPKGVPCGLENSGKPCAPVGDECIYLHECGATTLYCGEDNLWLLWDFTEPCCNGCCGDACLPDPPHAGEPCDRCFDGSGCYYGIDIGCGLDAGVSLSCDPSTSAWQVDVPACDLPADACKLHATAGECEADATCRWLVPGCDGAALAAEGCFAAQDCLACGEGEACTPVTVDPCPGEDCGSCADPAWVCQ